MRVRRFSAMQTPPTVDGALPPDPDVRHAPAVVPQRSTRRATARRASDRRATARQHKDDIDGRIIGYVKEHPQGTTGDMAKGLNADRGTIAAEVSHMVRAGELAKGPEPAHTLSDTSDVRGGGYWLISTHLAGRLPTAAACAPGLRHRRQWRRAAHLAARPHRPARRHLPRASLPRRPRRPPTTLRRRTARRERHALPLMWL